MTAQAATTRASGTRDRLLRAAEGLFAERGIGSTPTRAILAEAGQRNESALQYHFGGREGLIEAMYETRGGQVGAARAAMLEQLEESECPAEHDEAIRTLCEIAFMPAVRVARQDPSFASFLEVIGQLAFLPNRALQESQRRYEGETVEQIGQRLRPRLDLPDAIFEHRVGLISRMAATALTQRARAKEPFNGAQADLYFSNLVDAMAAVLLAPVSASTLSALEGRP